MFISPLFTNLAKFSYSQMATHQTIGIIGGGISSLSLLLNMTQKTNLEKDILQVKLFERKDKVGGRIEAEESP